MGRTKTRLVSGKIARPKRGLMLDGPLAKISEQQKRERILTAGWTAEQIIKLAPDSGAASAGKGLAAKHKWQSLGLSDSVAWGECQGSGKLPYQTEIFLEEPAFHCTCPSRKFPCKHSLGLFLLLADQPSAFSRPADGPPEWVRDWLEKRLKRQEKAQEVAAAPPKSKSAGKAGQAKRADQRQAKVTAGLADLRLWLGDLLRSGLAEAKGQPYKFWDSMAARMVDAQAPGVARRLREMGGIAAGGNGWQEELLERLGQLHLLLEGYRHLEQLPAGLQAEVRAQVGWTQSQDELAQEAGILDRWLVLGQSREEDDNHLKMQRTWLWGSQSGRPAVVFDFAYGSQPLDSSLAPGSSFDGEVVYFPGAYPLRALVKPGARHYPTFEDWPGAAGCSEIIEAYSQALGENPWLELFPVALSAVYPVRSGDDWQIRDEAGRCLPVEPAFPKGWPLLALSGGYSVGLFGLWDGRYLQPYSAWAEQRFIDLEENI